MKKHLTEILCFSLFVFCEAFSQSMFQKTIGGQSGDFSYSASLTYDGGYIFCGNTGSFAGTSDVYLVKTNANADTLWTRTYGTADQDFGYCVVQTADSGYIISGRTGVSPVQNVYLIKTDAEGDTLWTRIIGGPGLEAGVSVIQSADGGFVVIGSTTSFGQGFEDVYMIKTNASGDTLWTRTFGETTNETGEEVKQTSDGGYIITGDASNILFHTNALLIKTDSSGNITWSKVYGDWGIDFGYAVEQTNDNGFIVAGHSTGSVPGEAYLIKTDSAGNLQWSKTYGGADTDIAEDVEQTADNGYIFSGRTQSFGVTGTDVYLVKTDAAGNLQWSKNYGDTVTSGMMVDANENVYQTSDGGYIMGGLSNSFGSGDMDMFIIKTDANGNSGCYEGNPPTLENTFQILVTNYPLITGSGATIFPSVTITGTGGTNSILCASSGINETANNNSILIFPNPSAGSFIVSLRDIPVKGTVEILNMYGERIFKELILNETQKEIHLKDISPGIYFVRINDGEKYYSRKIIVY